MNQCIIAAIKNKSARKAMTRGLIATFLGVFVLAGCGSGGGGNGTQAATPPAPTPIAMYGDSTMVGYTYPNGPTQPSIVTPNNAVASMTSTLQQMGYTIAVTNGAVNGAEVDDILNGTDGYTAPWSQAASSVAAKIVVANFGINDSFLGHESPDQYAQGLITLVNVARSDGKTPVLEEPNPVCRGDITNLDAYVAQMDAVATQMNVPLIKQYDYIKSIPNWQALLSDCIHPIPSLYQIKGQREAQVLAALIK